MSIELVMGSYISDVTFKRGVCYYSRGVLLFKGGCYYSAHANVCVFVYNFYLHLFIVFFVCLLMLIGRAKRAPHWGVQSRIRVIYVCIYVGMSRMSN